ncbi:MAG: DUF1732 domain-containing protein [Nannocystaceae bacterium]
MTGFGTAARPWDGASPAGAGAVEVEVRSVNARHLEIKIRQPFGPRAEQAVRARVEACCGRGRIDVAINLRSAGVESSQAGLGIAAVGVDPQHADAVLRAAAEIQQLAARRSLELSPPNALDVLRFLVTTTRAGEPGTPAAPPFLDELVDAALAQLASFRSSEGEALGRVLTGRHRELRAHVERIAELVRTDAVHLGERVLARVRELCQAAGVAMPDDARLHQEIALLASKADVAEELARLDMHLSRMDAVLAAPATVGQGRTLEFVAQELLREITTIGSKVVNHAAAARVIDAKGTIERIREQVSNVE